MGQDMYCHRGDVLLERCCEYVWCVQGTKRADENICMWIGLYVLVECDHMKYTREDILSSGQHRNFEDRRQRCAIAFRS